MLERLARFIVRRRRLVLVATLAFVLVAGAVGGQVASKLSTGGFEDPNAESTIANDVLEERFGQADPNLFLLVSAKRGSINDAAARAAGVELTRELREEPGVEQVLGHWDLGDASPLASRDGTKALIVARIAGDEDEQNERAGVISESYNRETEAVTVGVGGFAEAFRHIGETIERDLAKAEAIAIPITLILLVLVFGSVVAAGLPLGIGIVAIIGTFMILRVIAELTQVSIFALNMVTAMGLGLSIDYSLFIVSRFREEVRAGLSTDDAVVKTVRTAGRTIVVSGITVAVSLSALLVFPLPFLRSFAYAGIGVVAMAVVGAVVFLPGALAALGPRVDRWVLFRRHTPEVGEGFWHRIAVAVMRRPIPVATGVVAVLLFLGVPFLGIQLGLPDDRVLPPGDPVRAVNDTLRTDFAADEVQALRVVAPDAAPEQTADVDLYARNLSRLDGAARVEAVTGTYVDSTRVADPSFVAQRFVGEGATWFQVVPDVDPMSADGERLVHDVRQTDPPFGGDVLVSGPSAQLVDAKDALSGVIPLALVLIAVATFVLLFLAFGSILVPLKALVLNLLSLTATFGAMVWVFQDGNLSGVLNFTATGTIDATSPILMFCIAFGLSMDYEVFLLSRIREEYDRSGDNVSSVAIGLERTGRIVTAAAVLISVVFLATGTSSVRFIKLFGIGMALAVLMDAFVIRSTLVPAFMRLAGRANWWLPSWLQGTWERFRIRDEAPMATAEPELVLAEAASGELDKVWEMRR